MGINSALISIATLAFSTLLTGIVRRFAVSRGLLDVPNARSSHSAVTPRGGGLAIVLAATAAAALLGWMGRVSLELLLALGGGGIAVAAIGFLDDRRPVPARLRLTVHVCAAFWAVAWLGGPDAIQVGQHVIHLGWIGPVLAVFALVWALNLFNFMDGIDGIAASEAIFMSCGWAIVLLAAGGASGASHLPLVLGAACGGFLLWNWPPAKIFMGDIGSGYLGYCIGVLILGSLRTNPGALWPWLILGGVFFVDATVTLIRRSLRGERVYEAHRSHAYQWLARHWRSHARVTLSVIGINLLWLLPWAVAAAVQPRYGSWIALAALAPLAGLAIALGAGRTESA